MRFDFIRYVDPFTYDFFLFWLNGTIVVASAGVIAIIVWKLARPKHKHV